jgi:hypothetical protein
MLVAATQALQEHPDDAAHAQGMTNLRHSFFTALTQRSAKALRLGPLGGMMTVADG